MTNKRNKKQIKEHTTNEKPISLSPLEFKEALAALLQVKPENKESKAKKSDSD